MIDLSSFCINPAAALFKSEFTTLEISSSRNSRFAEDLAISLSLCVSFKASIAKERMSLATEGDE